MHAELGGAIGTRAASKRAGLWRKVQLRYIRIAGQHNHGGFSQQNASQRGATPRAKTINAMEQSGYLFLLMSGFEIPRLNDGGLTGSGIFEF